MFPNPDTMRQEHLEIKFYPTLYKNLIMPNFPRASFSCNFPKYQYYTALRHFRLFQESENSGQAPLLLHVNANSRTYYCRKSFVNSSKGKRPNLLNSSPRD